MIKEEMDIELVEMKVELSHLRKLVQKGIREDLEQRIYVGKRVKLPIRELFAEKLMLGKVEDEGVEYICEPEKGPLLGEGDSDDSDDSDEEMIYIDQHERKVLVASSQERESHNFGINYFCECTFVGMQLNEIDSVKEVETRETEKEMQEDFQDFDWWRKLKDMSKWLCLLLVKTYWIMLEGILTWIENQWKMDRGREANALQGCEVKRSEANTENLAKEVKSRKSLKDQSLIIEEKETLLSYLDKLSVGENCEGQGDVI